MAATFQLLDYCLFVAVLFISALIGIYYLLKEKWMAKAATSDDILMGGREMHLFPVAMSLVASYMSAITVLGIPTEMYVFGTQYWLVALSGFMTYPVTCHVFLPFFHNLQLASAYQVSYEYHRVKNCFCSKQPDQCHCYLILRTGLQVVLFFTRCLCPLSSSFWLWYIMRGGVVFFFILFGYQ